MGVIFMIKRLADSRYLIKNFLTENLMKCVQGVPSNRVLDVGCGKKPYRHYFPKASDYVGIDRRSISADVRAIGEYIPFKSKNFDVALCTQVLEHVENSENVLAELNRILTDQGVLILSTHGIWIECHEPTDYWRWTLQGLTKSLEDAGFEVTKSYSMEPYPSLFQFVSLYVPTNRLGNLIQICINLTSSILRKFTNKGPKLHIVHVIQATKKFHVLYKKRRLLKYHN